MVLTKRIAGFENEIVKLVASRCAIAIWALTRAKSFEMAKKIQTYE